MSTPEIILAIDTGGTNTRLGIVAAQKGQKPQGPKNLASYKNKDFDGLVHIMRQYINDNPGSNYHAVCIAIAGFFVGDHLVSKNIPWQISLETLRAAFPGVSLETINDFAAIALSVNYLAEQDFEELNPTSTAQPGSVKAVIGPGTGMGAAFLDPGPGKTRIYSSELGSATFAPSNKLEREIVKVIAAERGHVSNECLLSGPGIFNIYRALCLIHGRAPETFDEQGVYRLALEGECKIALETFGVFSDCLGSMAGDATLCYGATGGMYLSGGVPLRIGALFDRHRCLQRYLDKGEGHKYLETVPLRLITREYLGVFGAGCWALTSATHGE